MTTYSKALGVVASIAILASCSGGSVGSSNAPIQTAPAAYKTAKLKVKFAVPSKTTMAKRMPNLANVYGAGRAPQAGHPHFIGIATTEIDLTLTSLNGSPPGTNVYNSVVYTDPNGVRNSGCTSSNYSGYKCQTVIVAPAATDVYNVSAYWCASPISDGSCPGTKTLISEGNFTVVVSPGGGGGTASLTLDPVVGSIDWLPPGYDYTGLETWTNGQSAPVISGTSYACPGGGCYDPLLNGAPYAAYSLPATPTWDYLMLAAFDANGDYIIPAYSVYNKPIYLTADGAVDSITSSCVDGSSVIDPDVALTNYNYSNPIPAPVPSAALVHGFTGSAAAMNAPQNSTGGTTDLDGNAVTAVDNNSYTVNFDGNSAAYTTSSLDSCQATDSSTPALKSSKYYIGFAFGTVVVVNGRHAGSHKR